MQSPAWRALLTQALADRAERIRKLTGPERWLQDRDAVHDVRVASRRLRQALDLVEPDWVAGWARQRRRARALTRALGATRELDVHTLRLAALAPALHNGTCHAVLAHLMEEVDRRRRKARARMARELARVDLPALVELADRGQMPTPAGDRPFALRERIAPLLEGVRAELGALAGDEPAALHRLRIAVKKLRYALELLAPALPTPARDIPARLKDCQDALGDHHDWWTLETALWDQHAALLERARPALSTGTLELLGLVVERRREALASLPAAAAVLDRVGELEDCLLATGGAGA